MSKADAIFTQNYGYQLSVKHRVKGIDLGKARELFGNDGVETMPIFNDHGKPHTQYGHVVVEQYHNFSPCSLGSPASPSGRSPTLPYPLAVMEDQE